MTKLIFILLLFNSISFLVYGTSCIFTEKAKIEFERYNMSDLRIYVGLAQLMLSLLMLMGLKYRWLIFLSSIGLALMMAYAIKVRYDINDSFLLTIPAYLYFCSTLVLAYLTVPQNFFKT